MNANRRKQITEAIKAINELTERIDEIKCFIDDIKCEEEECYDNLPESLQDGERGDMMQEAIDNLDSAYSSLEDIDFDETISYLEDAQA